MEPEKYLHILVVEDNEGDWFLLKEHLKDSFNENFIDNCKTLKDAVEALAQIRYNIIFLDLSLPDSSGFESIQKIAAVTSETPIVVLTGYSDKQFAIETLQYGVQDYLLKDEVTPSLLVKSINYSIERNRQKLKSHTAQMQKGVEIFDAIINGQEKERLNISIELHDNVTQILAGCRMFLNMAQKEGVNAAKYLKDTDDLLLSAISEIRKLSHALAPPDYNGSSFEESLKRLLDNLQSTSGIAVHKNWDTVALNGLSEKLKLNLFRIIQEQINNILKHAKAKNVKLKIAQTKTAISLIITDDGIGFDTTKQYLGIGLSNIKTRAAIFSGTVTVNSSPLGGCELKVEMKIN